MAEEVLDGTPTSGPASPSTRQVSVALQEAVESVVTGTSPEDAAANYQAALEEIVGADAIAALVTRPRGTASGDRRWRPAPQPAAESLA